MSLVKTCSDIKLYNVRYFGWLDPMKSKAFRCLVVSPSAIPLVAPYIMSHSDIFGKDIDLVSEDQNLVIRFDAEPSIRTTRQNNMFGDIGFLDESSFNDGSLDNYISEIIYDRFTKRDFKCALDEMGVCGRLAVLTNGKTSWIYRRWNLNL